MGVLIDPGGLRFSLNNTERNRVRHVEEHFGYRWMVSHVLAVVSRF